MFKLHGLSISETNFQLPDLSEIYIVGFYPAEEFTDFINDCKAKYILPIRYLEESGSLGTAGGLLKFESILLQGNPKGVFILNADICGDLPVAEMVHELETQPPGILGILLTTEATREQSINFGSVVVDQEGKVLHYVDKPTTFVSTHISCGIYLLRPEIWKLLSKEIKNGGIPQIWFESDIFPQMASNGTLHALHTTRWWSQTKTAGAALYANRHYLRLYRERCPERLCSKGAKIEGDFDDFKHP